MAMSKEVEDVHISTEMSNFNKLERKRRTLKSYLTRTEKMLNNLESSLSIVELQSRLEELLINKRKYDDCQDQIEELNLEDEETYEYERYTFERRYYDIRTKLSTLLDNMTTTSRSSTQVGGIAGMSIHSEPRQPNRSYLPKLPLPTFSGDYRKWPSFFNTFKTMVHDNEYESNINKFHYLRSCLQGDAEALLDGLEASETSYQMALKLLERRYNHKRRIILSHVRALLNVERAVANPTSLRTMHTKFLSELNALNAMKEPVEQWDTLLIGIMVWKLDDQTLDAWELSLNSSVLPAFDELSKFVEARCNSLEAYEESQPCQSMITTKPISNQAHLGKRKVCLVTSATPISNKCPCCNGNHRIYACSQFKEMSPAERVQLVKRVRLCYNCLSDRHTVANCIGGNCKTCSQRHNSLLHLPKKTAHVTTIESEQLQGSINDKECSEVVSAYCNKESNKRVLLATAMVIVTDHNKVNHKLRAMLDSGSQINIVSAAVVKRLNLATTPRNLKIRGVGNFRTRADSQTTLEIQSLYSSHSWTLEFQVVDHLLGFLPNEQVLTDTWQVPTVIQEQLADPTFTDPGQIDLLLGAEMFFDILDGDKWIPSNGIPLFVKTQLGWIISGPLPSTSKKSSYQVNCLFQVWDTETQEEAHKIKSREELECEEHFRTNYSRTKSGRFTVRLPLKESSQNLGDSLCIATKRFLRLENRFRVQPKLKDQYNNFMDEYKSLNHMEEVSVNSSTEYKCYYLPHHPVFREDSITTKLRVVFDASAKTTANNSLNDLMMIGPNVQSDLATILLKFRTHKIAFCADITKMYRQILVDPQDRDLQRIVWRNASHEQLKHYRLRTVTYGTASAPFLATRCLKQIGMDAEEYDREAAHAIQHDFYVDDFLSGSTSVMKAHSLQIRVQQILSQAGFELRKWCTNSVELQDKMEQHPCAQEEHFLINMNNQDSVKSLGLSWNPTRDELQFKTQVPESHSLYTKRIILGELSKMFDPLGLLSPVIIKGRIFVQQLWQEKVSWDEPLSDDIQRRWKLYEGELTLAQEIKVPRRVQMSDNIELVGFFDASQYAYGACIYVRSEQGNQSWIARLICAKSRVASLKQTTIPRLELNAALLLAQLTKKVGQALGVSTSNFILFSDSSIVLTWINRMSGTLATYVGNRISEIHDITNSEQWQHVRTSQNPADLISRGMTVQQLSNSQMWWSGPEFMTRPRQEWPVSEVVLIENPPEIRRNKLVLMTCEETNQFLERYSTWTRLVRTTAWIQRFMVNVRARVDNKGFSKEKDGFTLSPSLSSALTLSELQRAKETWYKIAQENAFRQELNDLKENREVKKGSTIRGLTPWLDKNGLLRVGGRLKYANVQFSQKHAVLLPAQHRITTLIAEAEHLKLLHAGPQLMLNHLRQTVWPIQGKSLMTKVVRNCKKCFQAKPRGIQPQMGQLPSARVQSGRAFAITGVDFCGPIMVRSGFGRNTKKEKAYVAVFICFWSKAIHLELVSGLSTEKFIAALRRFMARRGICREIQSDNATNFKGAARELQNLFKAGISTRSAPEVMTECGIQWKFIPPRAPHFGGIWEAAVKSTKHHLKRVIGLSTLTFEEMSTLLSQIEACLNSRPITPMSSDPNDYEALTPAHFLVGSSLLFPVETEITNDNPTRRYKQIQVMRQHFWKRWSKEYLSQLNHQQKWYKREKQLKIGMLALLSEDNVAPLQWNLVRITDVHPGSDGVIRVVTVKTGAGHILKRSANRIYVLPSNDKNESNPPQK